MVSGSQSNLTGVAKHFGIANADRERCVDLLTGLGVTAVQVQRPGIGVEGEHIVPTGVFGLRNFQGFYRLMRMIRVVEDQLAIGIVRAHAFEH